MAETSRLTLGFLRRQPQSAANVLEDLPCESAASFLLDVPPRVAAPVIMCMSPCPAGLCLQAAGRDYMLAVLPLMPASSCAAILRRLPVIDSETLLAALPAQKTFHLRLLLRYPANAVGAWMDPDVPVLKSGIKVGTARKRLLAEHGTLDRFLYTVGAGQAFTGRVSTLELLQADGNMLLDRLIVEAPFILRARSSIGSLLDDSRWRDMDPLPVLSSDGRFLGIARFANLYHGVSALQEGLERSVFTEALIELMESCWTGFARLAESPFQRRPRPHERTAAAEEKS